MRTSFDQDASNEITGITWWQIYLYQELLGIIQNSLLGVWQVFQSGYSYLNLFDSRRRSFWFPGSSDRLQSRSQNAFCHVTWPSYFILPILLNNFH